MAYRKHKDRDVWHWCRNCQNWPLTDFVERPTKPANGELCNECRVKERDGTCRC